MAGNHLLSISSISEFFKDSIKQLKRGEVAYKDNHVLKFQADMNLQIITGEIKPSMKNGSYKVQLYLKDGCLSDAQCSCPRGIVCHHIATLALHTHYNISSTDTACSWSFRKSSSTEDIKTISDIYGKFECPDVNVSEKDISCFQQTLTNLSFPTGFSWLFKPEPDPVKLPTVLIEAIRSILLNKQCKDLVKSKDFCKFKTYFLTKCSITDALVLQIVNDTVGQHKNNLWFTYRKNRLTASHFGKVLACCKRNKFPNSLYKSLNNDTNLNGVHAIQWGITNESCGINILEQEETVSVIPTGLWLSNNGFLGASPDGLVGTNHIVEVKCPWKFRNKVLSTEIENDHSYIIYKENDHILVNKQHPYWDQIQGQLYLTNRKLCYLVIWTPMQSIITEVQKDDEWESNLGILESFFIQKYIPYLIENNL